MSDSELSKKVGDFAALCGKTWPRQNPVVSVENLLPYGERKIAVLFDGQPVLTDWGAPLKFDIEELGEPARIIEAMQTALA